MKSKSEVPSSGTVAYYEYLKYTLEMSFCAANTCCFLNGLSINSSNELPFK